MDLPHARIMLHQPLGGTQGQASDLEIQTKEILVIREKLNQILANHTGQSIEKIAKDTDRNFFMSAEESKKYGIIDEVMDRKGLTKKKATTKAATKKSESK